MRRSRWISGAACLVAAAAALVLLIGCSASSEQPPKQWDKLTSGRLSGAQPSRVFLGTYHLGSEVRLAWVLSGPTDPHVALALRVDNAGTAASYTNTIFSPKDAPPRRSDNALGFIDIPTADYHVYLVQRFRSGQGPGFDVTYTLFTRGYVSGATPTGF
jgi:hypothetical protein